VRLKRLDRALLWRRLRFGAVNAAAAGVLMGGVIMPAASHVASLCEDLAQRAEQLASLQQFRQRTRQTPEPPEAIFFAAPEARLASADLHATLKSLTQQAGLQLLGLRSVTVRQPIASGNIAVGLELEGSAATLRDTLHKIETARPILVVTGLTLRPTTAETDAALRAELIVQGALRPPPARAIVEQGR
jgi:general secretion pathway protein M